MHITHSVIIDEDQLNSEILETSLNLIPNDESINSSLDISLL